MNQSPAEELPQRMEELCRFANGEMTKMFVHPVVQALTLHFWLAYDHPFCDGNGRTARALFYWAMLHQGDELFAFISISSVIHTTRGQYERPCLLSERDDNDLTDFLLAQVKVIQQAIGSLHTHLERKAGEVGALRQASTARCSPTRAAMGSAIRPPAAICGSCQPEDC